MVSLPLSNTTSLLRTSNILLLAAAIICSPGQSARAGVISSFGGAVGPGLGSVSFNSVGTPNPGNDDFVGASPNWISIDEKAFSTTEYIDMVFHVDDIGVPTTEYVLTEAVFNGTSDFWLGYQVILGFGTGAAFAQASLGDGLDFDTPDYNSPIDFTPLVIMLPLDDSVINAVDNIILPGEVHTFSFTIDVPNGITEFTIRQSPRTGPVSTSSGSWGNVKALYR